MNSGSFVSVMFPRPPSILNPFSIDKTPPPSHLKMSANTSNSLFTSPPPSRCTLQNKPIATLLTPHPLHPPFPAAPLKLSKGRSVTLKCVVVQETLETSSE